MVFRHRKISVCGERIVYNVENKILPGERYGRLTIICFVGRNSRGCPLFLVLCDCYTIKVVNGYNLLYEKTRSCGCLNRESVSIANKGRELSLEHKKKISIANKGKKLSSEHKKKISLSKMGNLNPSKRPEVRKKMSESAKNHPSNSLGCVRSEETKNKISEHRKGKCVGKYNPMKRIDLKKRLSDLNKGSNNPMYGKHGKDAGNWRGGISFEPYCQKFNDEFKERVRAFFGYKCMICGKSNAKSKIKLSVHHVEYNKQACCDGKPVHFAALCRSCHAKTNGNRERWEAMLHRIIDEIYNGRSYYTKKEYEELQCE